jgi:membrane protein
MLKPGPSEAVMPFARKRPPSRHAPPQEPRRPRALARPAAASEPSPGALAKASRELRSASWLALAALILFWPRQAGGSPPPSERRIQQLQPGRGRSARAPSQIPLRGWRDILWRTAREFGKDNIPWVSGGVTFFALLALFPGLAAFVALYGLFADFHDAVKHIEALAVIAPHDAVVFIGAQMIRISQQRHSTLSLAFVITLLLSLWSANNGMKAFLNGLNIAYGETEKRSFLQLTVHSLAFTVGGLALLLIAVAAVVVVPVFMPRLKDLNPIVNVLRWPGLGVLMILVLSVVYRYGPSRQHARWQWVSWGGVAAALLWMAASLAFSWYVSNLAHYNRTYGSFGAAAGAMTWLWMSVVIVLFGAELNAEIEHQTAVDSTTGAPLPMGRRGATMADTVGEPAPD